MNPIIWAVMAVENCRFHRPGRKEQFVHDLFGVSISRYYQSRRDILEQREALILDPILVNRLRRRQVA